MISPGPARGARTRGALKSATASLREASLRERGDLNMSDEINWDRRRLIISAVMTIASAELGMIDSFAAQSS